MDGFIDESILRLNLIPLTIIIFYIKAESEMSHMHPLKVAGENNSVRPLMLCHLSPTPFWSTSLDSDLSGVESGARSTITEGPAQ